MKNEIRPPSVADISKKSNMQAEEVTAFLDLLKRSMEPFLKRISVIENGTTRYYAVERRGIGILKTEHGKFWQYNFAIDDQWETNSKNMKQEIQSQATPKNDKRLIFAVVISVLITAFIVGFGVYYFVNKSNNQDIKSLQEQINNLKNTQANNTIPDIQQNQDTNTTNDLISGTVLLAMKNKRQNPPPANPENLVNEYFVVSFNPKNGEQKQLTLIKNNFFTDPFEFSNDKIFFETPAGEVASLDIKSNKQDTIKISGILPANQYLNENTLFDFLVFGNKIFYLKGYCSESLYCALGIYDTSTESNQIIIDNLHKQVKSKIFNSTMLVSYDSAKNILKFRDGGGDAGFASVSLYEINLSTKALTKIDSASSEYCGKNHTDCTPQQKAENEKFDRIFKPQINCSGATITESYNQVSVSGNTQKIFEDTHYIGCIIQ